MGTLVFEIFKLSNRLNVYLYTKEPGQVVEDLIKDEETIKTVWNRLKMGFQVKISANPKYRQDLSRVIVECEIKDIPTPIISEILLPLLSIPSSSLRSRLNEVPPIFMGKKEHIFDVIVNNYGKLQSYPILDQILRYLEYFNPYHRHIYDGLFTELSVSLFKVVFGDNKQEWLCIIQVIV
jgi:hypothetical protein